ncbi:hypothetical protein FRB96_006936 [Tulasnella sp. 330]|nr:hypothetical protein FRB96_006936 [Tulasnella sp. 330]KAG8876563.1 hypothetical protein FRB97_004116 [Tulasnella sp. 331]KAG8889842.1 hypothetical protein FRB98_002491 [Tulasnella sp. 332]
MSSSAQSTFRSGGIAEAIKKDHDELKEYYRKYETASTENEQIQWSNQFRWELARHSVGEELVVYPAFEKHLGAEGERIAREDRAEHQTAKELLYQLERSKVTDGEYPTLFKRLFEDLTVHMRGEEQTDLLMFEAVISQEESIALARSFERTKNFAPTRSHPGVSDKGGLFETAGGLAAAPIDKLRDLFASFPETA